MSERYIREQFSAIKEYANVIEQRIDDTWCTLEFVLAENKHYLEMCRKYGCHYTWIDDSYHVEVNLE